MANRSNSRTNTLNFDIFYRCCNLLTTKLVQVRQFVQGAFYDSFFYDEINERHDFGEYKSQESTTIALAALDCDIWSGVATILFVRYFLHIAPPLTAMFFVLLLLVIVNCISFYRYKFQKNISDKSLFIELLFDGEASTSKKPPNDKKPQ